MLFQRAELKRENSQLARLKQHGRGLPPLQNPSSLGTYADDEARREIFIADVGKRITAHGTLDTIEYLRTAFRFTKKQAKAVLDEARRELAAKMQAETEIMRNVGLARIESMLRRARDACDLTNEIRAFKEWARITGAYQTVEGTKGDLAALLRELSQDQGPDPKKVIDAEFTVEGEEQAEDHWQAPEDFKEFEEDRGPVD